MKRGLLSAAGWQTARQAHEALAGALVFPDHYGYNLDALFDCLTDLPATQLSIEQCARASAQLGDAWTGLMTVLLDAAKENPDLQVSLFPGDVDFID